MKDINTNAFEGNESTSCRPAGPDAPTLTETLTAYGAWNGIITKDENEEMISESYKMARLGSGSFGLEYNIPQLLTKDATSVLSFKAYTENTYTTVTANVLDSAGVSLCKYTFPSLPEQARFSCL